VDYVLHVKPEPYMRKAGADIATSPVCNSRVKLLIKAPLIAELANEAGGGQQGKERCR